MSRTLASTLSIVVSAAGVALFASTTPGAGGRASHVAFVTERVSDDGKAEGSFDVHWESESGHEWSQGPEGAEIDRALAWARAHAGIVIVYTADGHRYSAGEQPADGVQEVWPGAGLSFEPRPLATKWVVLVRVSSSGASDGGSQRALHVMEHSPLVESAEVVQDRDQIGVRVVVRGDSAPEALEVVSELLPRDVLTGWRDEPAGLEVLGPA